MKFKVKEKEYRIRWRYDSSTNPPFGREHTTCVIEEVLEENGELKFIHVADATVGRFHGDRFSYENARKASLKKVLNKTFSNLPERQFFSKEFRTAAWDVYFDRKPEIVMVKMELKEITKEDIENMPDFLLGERGINVGDKYLKPL